MEKFILQNCSPEERKQKLEEFSQGKEKLTYMRSLTEAEIEYESRKLASLCRERNDLEQEKADINKEYGDKIKDVKAKIDGHTKTLIDGEKEESATCYKFINIDTREVGFYNKDGELVRVRPALDQDLQLDMFHRAPSSEPIAELPAGDPNPDIEEAEIVSEDEDTANENNSSQTAQDDAQESEEEEEPEPWYNK